MRNYFMRIHSLPGGLVNFIKSQHTALYVHLDAVQKKVTENENAVVHKPETARQFKFAFVIYFVLVFDGIFGMFLEYTELDLDTFVHDFVNCPYTTSHQMIPPIMWLQTDLIILGTAAAVLLLFANLSLNCELPVECQLVQDGSKLISGSKVLHPKISSKIIKISTKGRMLILWVNFVGCFVVYCYCYYHILVTNGVFRATFHSILVLFVEFLIFIGYKIYVALSIVIFVIMSSTYIQIQQNHILQRLAKINKSLRTLKLNPNSNYNIHLKYLHHKYLLANRDILRISKSIKAHSQFWSPLLTVMLPYYILIPCYLLYLVVFPKKVPVTYQWIYFMILAEMISVTFALVQKCAAVADFNERILVQNRKFTIELSQLQKDNQRKVVGFCDLLKAETFQNSDRLHTYAFRLANNTRITMEIFYGIMFYISICFMAVYKPN